jgi:retron-type reverse transcriptase
MRRIEVPDYLHSGISGRSNVTNAKVHVGHHPLLKTDIKSFYESTTARLVNRVFRDIMQCSPDVSAVLTRLCTANGHVPTGSSLSQLLAFYVVKPRLGEFAAMCKKRDVTLSVYVDDITISGKGASRKLLYQLKRLLAKDGYSCHKDAQYRAADAKIVTGVVVTARGVRVRNKQHQQIYEELRGLLGREPNSLDEKNYERLQGRIASASQIDAAIIEQKRRLNSWKKDHRQSGTDAKRALSNSGFVGCDSGESDLSRNYKRKLIDPAHDAGFDNI